jgi:hypothetical protein
MNKYLIMKVADAIVNVYGSTLMQDETDIKMAKAAIRACKLPKQIANITALSKNNIDKKYNKWQIKRMIDADYWEYESDLYGKETGYLCDGVKRWKVKR